MPTISFETIEDSDYTGLPTTEHDYQYGKLPNGDTYVHYFRDRIHISTFYRSDADAVLESLIGKDGKDGKDGISGTKKKAST